MEMITIDGKEYKVDELSEEAKSQLASMQFVDQEIASLSARIAAMQTARNAYGLELRAILNENSENKTEQDAIEILGDNIEFE